MADIQLSFLCFIVREDDRIVPSLVCPRPNELVVHGGRKVIPQRRTHGGAIRDEKVTDAQ